MQLFVWLFVIIYLIICNHLHDNLIIELFGYLLFWDNFASEGSHTSRFSTKNLKSIEDRHQYDN